MPLERDADIEMAISQLLEDESLTEEVDDAPASVLLDWGVGCLKAGQESSGVRRTVRTLSKLVRDRRWLSPEDARRQLERVVGADWPAGAESSLAALLAEGESLSAEEWAGRIGTLVGELLGTTSGHESLMGETDSTTATPPPAQLSGEPAPPPQPGRPRPWRRWTRFWRRRP